MAAKKKNEPHKSHGIGKNVCQQKDSITCLGSTKLTLKGELDKKGECVIGKKVEMKSADCGHSLEDQAKEEKGKKKK